MADLGNLWFSLGLDDKKFEKQWNAAFAKYKQQAKIDVGVQIAPTDLTQLNDIQNKLNAFANRFNGNTKAKIDLEVTPNTLQALQALKSLGGTKGDWAAVKEAAKALREVSKAATQAAMDQQKLNNQVAKGQKKVNANYNQQSLWLQNLSNLASNYFSLYTVKNFATELATVTGEFEKQRVTLQAMVGEMEGLDIYNKMKELSVQSPFQFKDLASYAKQLAAFSVPYNELYDTTKRLADVSAGLGVDMSRIILAYGQIRSAGVLRGTELRQLTEAGVPILEKLADKIYEATGKTVALGDVFDKVSQKAISFEMVKEVFEDMTSAGGKFYNMQEVQAETLSGKISNLKDAYAIMLTEIGENTEGMLKGSVEWLYKLIENWENVGRAVISVAGAYGIYQATHVAMFSWEKLKLVGLFAKKMLEFHFNIKKAAESMIALKVASSSGVWGVILGVLTAIGLALWQADKAAKAFNKELDRIYNKQTSELKREERAFEELKKAIEGATEGSQARREAIDEFNNQFGPYLQNLLTETNTATELAIAYDKVTEAIKNKNKQEGFIKAQTLIDEEYGTKISTTLSSMVKRLKKGSESWSGLDEDLAEDVAVKIRTELEKNINITRSELEEILKKRFGEEVGRSAIHILDNISDSGQEILTQKDLIKVLQGELEEYNSKLVSTRKEYERLSQTDNFSLKAEEELVNRVNNFYEKRLADLKEQKNLTKEQFEEEKKQIELLKYQELAEGYGAMGLTKMADMYDAEWEALIKKTDGWRAKISESVEKLGLTVGFAPKIDETYPKYVARIREEWKNTTEAIEKYNGKDVDGGLKVLKKEKNALTKLAELCGIILDPKKDTKDAKEEERKRINALKDEYNWLVKVYEAYKKYIEEGVSVKDAKNMVLGDFTDIPINFKPAFEGETDIYTWFRTEMGRLAAEAEKKGSDTGIAFKSGLVRKMGTINAEEVLKSLKLGEKIQDELTKWGLEDFALTGEGVTLDISKAIKDQFVADNEAFSRRKELLDRIAEAERGNEAQINALKKEYGENWLVEAKERANELYELEIANNRKIAEDKIKEMGKAYAKQAIEGSFTTDFFSNLSEKTFTQLKEASAKLKGMIASPSFLMDTDYLDKVASGELSQEQIDKHIEQWKEYISLLQGDTDVQHFEKVKKAVVETGKALSDVIGSIRDLAKQDSVFSGLLEGLGVGVDAATNIAGAFEKKVTYDKEGNKLSESLSLNWGSIASSAAALVGNIIRSVIAARQYRDEMARAAESFTASITASRRELKIAGEEFETIFGENLISALQADSEAISEISRELKTASSEVSKMKVVTRKGFFGIGVKQTTLKDLAPQLFKADGSVNYEYLDEFLEAYGDKLSDSQKTLLENLKNTYSQYENAMADTTEYLKGIFSDTASTIAERMMDSFAQTGDAATELGDLVSGVAKQMAKDLIQSLLVDQYLTPAMDRIKALYNPQDKAYEQDATLRTQKAIVAMQDAISAAGQAVPEVNRLLEAIQAMGVDLSADSENASQVLSGLTEDQQNLLVSYINAIRADVSMNKGMLTSIVNSVGTINNNIATAIVIWTQIEANTHRSADGVDRIIGFFESVMGPYDGGAGQAFQVNIA